MRISTSLLVVVLIGIAGNACNNKGNANPEATAKRSKAEAVSATVQTVTSTNQDADTTSAEVVLVKYSDYQCPACKYYAEFVERAKEEYGDKLEVVYKHFPLSIHPYAELAARASEAARVQGKFEEMHELLFAGQQQWSRGNAEAIFLGYARSLDLDMEQFRKDLNSAAMQRIVIADKREGRQLGINSTPTIYINDIKLESNPRYYEDFKAVIEQALNESTED